MNTTTLDPAIAPTLAFSAKTITGKIEELRDLLEDSRKLPATDPVGIANVRGQIGALRSLLNDAGYSRTREGVQALRAAAPAVGGRGLYD